MTQSIYTEYANLTPDKIQWLDGCGAKTGSGRLASKMIEERAMDGYTISFNENHEFMTAPLEWYKVETNYTHILTGSEFCERVAEILGIEKPRFGEVTGNILTQNEIDKIIEFDKPTYPHRLYRVLDSLDGIPLDTRIPLSEWIPPMGEEVLLITDTYFARAKFNWITTKPIFQTPFSEHGVEVDGHWMRIV